MMLVGWQREMTAACWAGNLMSKDNVGRLECLELQCSPEQNRSTRTQGARLGHTIRSIDAANKGTREGQPRQVKCSVKALKHTDEAYKAAHAYRYPVED
jgi:hypothetical protein